MVDKPLETPVLFIVFSRLETTGKVFQAIRRERPRKLFIAADGPRAGNKLDEVNCKKVREIVNKVDWPCVVKKRFSKKNQGCRVAESEAINWFFENVEEGIILEDDDLPNRSFFKFCGEMLEKYRDDERVMHISGNNFQRGWKRDEYSYYFSRNPHIWGFATWRRAWKKYYDVDTKIYPEIVRKGYFSDIFDNAFEKRTLMSNLNSTHYNNFDTWDYQWVFAVAVNNGLAIIPNENLVRNIGMTSSAVHTSSILDEEFSLPTNELEFPLKRPPFIIHDKKSDRRYFWWLFVKKLRNLILRKTGLAVFFKRK